MTQPWSGSPQSGRAFSLLSELYADAVMTDVFSEHRTVEGWLAAEAALARAQAAQGVISEHDAQLISQAAVLSSLDLPTLWEQARNVGYPILPMVRMISAALPEGPGGRVHLGATTQDIMDTGLALQLVQALQRLDDLLRGFATALATLVETHASTTMAARTHAQHAVPTTFGAKAAVFLREVLRHRDRLRELRPRACQVSLHGAAGTSAALGPRASAIRGEMADRLGLQASAVPWHVSRDAVAEFAALCALTAATSSRWAREVIDLSRTEIGEVSEPRGHHRGASSTMPQKANAILSEAIIGMAVTNGSLASAAYRAMEAGHERAAGEWHVEWQVVPQMAVLAASSLALAAEVAEGLVVLPDTMRRNLDLDSGLVMSEAHMMRLAPDLGRERAHDVVYEAAVAARRSGRGLNEETAAAFESATGSEAYVSTVTPDEYLGDVANVCSEALARWEESVHRDGVGGSAS